MRKGKSIDRLIFCSLNSFTEEELDFIIYYDPVKEWNKLRKKYKGIELEVNDIPGWHKDYS